MSKPIKIKTRDIAIASIFLSLIMIFMLAPIPSPLGVSLAFIPLIAVVIAADVQGLGMGIFAGVSFGVASLISAFIRPVLLSPVFYNPMVSIVPRAIIPVTAYFVFKGMKKLLSKRSDDASTYIASVASAIVATCTNTALVLSMMAAFNFGDAFGDTTLDAAFFGGLLGVNFLFEVVICALLAPPIVTGLRIALRLDKKGRKVGEKKEAESAPTEVSEDRDRADS